LKFIRGRAYADYAKSVRVAAEVLEDYGITQVPIQLEKIIEPLSNEIALMTYTQFMAMSGLDYAAVVKLMDSDLGACAFNAQSAQYVIYYNDTLSEAWCRFTIAHELGHIFLEHHLIAGTDVLSRTFVAKAQYKEYENEANAFARNLLSPAPLARLVIKNKPDSDISDMEKAFFITSKAAETRIAFLKRDLPYCTQEITAQLLGIRIMEYLSSCKECGYALPEVAEFCPACGSTKRKKQFYFKRLPEPVYVDPLHSVLMCPHCGNTDLGLGARFCRICGKPAINVCHGHQRGRFAGQRHYNPHYARFCLVCGAKTVFQTYNVLQEDIEYMHTPIEYNDGVPFDEETMRIEQCPRCHNRVFSNNAQFCRICGLNLYNMCDGGVEDERGEIWYSEERQHPNPSNARFCERCGRPTYFSINGIMCDFKNFNPKNGDAGDDDNSWLESSTVYQEIAAAPESEGYVPANVNIQTLDSSDDDEELPF
jgi:Zn-dependent peptidase ImmA (M78 family)/RNA polymerase subunit RPABC4/transcription elongation factor Spt4